MIERIEAFGAELYSEALNGVKLLHQSHIPILVAGADDHVPSGISKGIERRSNKAGGIVEALDGLLGSRQVSVAHPIGALQGSGVGGRRGHIHGEWCSRL